MGAKVNRFSVSKPNQETHQILVFFVTLLTLTQSPWTLETFDERLPPIVKLAYAQPRAQMLATSLTDDPIRVHSCEQNETAGCIREA